MANIHYTHQWDQDDYASDAQSYDVTPKSSILNPLKSLAYLLGAFISIALLGGIALWGYQLVERDVSGVPVVRAASGEMRVRPEDPGGQLAQNTGLSVNTIAAHGTAAAPADRLILAPRPLDLADVTVAELTDTAPSVADTQQPLHQASLRTDPDVANLVAALTEGESPLVNIQVDPAPSIIAAPVRVSLTSAAATEPVLIARVDGPTSLRPRVRPVQLARPAPAAPAVSRTAQVDELAPTRVPVGARLAQLGAFDSPTTARKEWQRLEARFGGYLAGKVRVVQQAESGGRTFYRLRAHGFKDQADARRFCAALLAERQDCIPVVMR